MFLSGQRLLRSQLDQQPDLGGIHQHFFLTNPGDKKNAQIWRGIMTIPIGIVEEHMRTCEHAVIWHESWLVVWNMNGLWLSIQLGISSFQLTNSLKLLDVRPGDDSPSWLPRWIKAMSSENMRNRVSWFLGFLVYTPHELVRYNWYNPRNHSVSGCKL